MSIFYILKSIVPVIIFATTFFLILRALTGKTEWLLMIVIVLSPLRNVIEKLHAFPFGGDFLDILFIVLIIGTFIRNGRMQSNNAVGLKSPISTVVFIMIGYTFISLLIGSDYLGRYLLFDLADTRIQNWKNFCLMPVLFFITLNTVTDKKWVWRTVAVMCLTIVLMDVYLVRQLSWYTDIISRTKVRGTFFYLGPNEVAAFYTQYTVLLMGLYFFMKKGIKKLILLGIILINIFCVLFLFSRAAYLALAVGMFFLFAIKNKKLLVPLLLVVVYWQVALPQKVQDRILETTDVYGELDRASELRLIVWQNAIDLFYESPIIGMGYGVFSESGFVVGDAHNIYLRILAEQGLVGLMIFLILLFVLFVQGIKLFLGGDDDPSRGLGLGFFMCIIVLMVNNMFGDRWTYTEVSAYLWVFAALVVRCNIISSQKDAERKTVKKRK